MIYANVFKQTCSAKLDSVAQEAKEKAFMKTMF